MERIQAAYPSVFSPPTLDTMEFQEEGFGVAAVLANPGLMRRDRRFIQIFINRRRIFSYPLIQAVEYAYSPYMPGGSFPAAFLFLQIDPELVDFNVHPAKKEARIRNQNRIHQSLVQRIRDHVSRFSAPSSGISESKFRESAAVELFETASDADHHLPSSGPSMQGHKARPLDTERLREGRSADAFSIDDSGPYRYLGQVFDLFLVVEGPDSLYLIDQHAAHEKILYDRLKASKQEAQELLFPISFDVSEEEEEELSPRLTGLAALGIQISRMGGRSYEISALPADLLAIEEAELVEALKLPDVSLRQLEEKIYSLAACRAAVKDGEAIDPITAGEIIRQSLRWENARCPHGRPIWHRITRKELYRYVLRSQL